MKRKWWVITSFVMVVGLVLAGCAPAATPTPERIVETVEVPVVETVVVTPTATPHGPVTLRFTILGLPEQAEVWRWFVDEFEAKYPDIQLEVMPIPAESWGEYFDKIAVMIAGGNPPDLALVAIEGAQLFASKGVAIPLDNYIERDKEELQDYFDDVHPSLLKALQYEGSQYHLPFDWNNMVIYYNTKLFEEYGIERPPDDWTVDDFLAIAKQLTLDEDKDGEPERFGFAFANAYFWGTMPWVFNFGSNLLTPDWIWSESNANDPDVIAAIQFLRDLVLEHKVAPAPALAGSWDIPSMMAAGKVAMFGCGRWCVLSLDGAGFYDFDILPMPKAKRQITEFGTAGYVILRSSPHPEEAWQFIKYLTTKEAFECFAALGWAIPARRSVAYDPEIMAKLPPAHYKMFYDSLENSMPVPSPPEFAEVESIWLRYAGLVFAGELTAEEGCQKAHEEISALLAKRE